MSVPTDTYGPVHHDEILFDLECEFVLGKPWCPTDSVDPAAVAAIEAAVGRPMPALLKQVYLKLGDGHAAAARRPSGAPGGTCRNRTDRR